MSHIVPRESSTPRPSNALMRGATLIKDASRLREIATVAVRHGFGEVLERLNLKDNVVVSILARRDGEEEAALTMPERARLAMQELGPTFVKLGQILSTRPDIVPLEYIEELKRLQDDVTPLPFEEIRELVEGSSHRELEEVFSDFNPVPVAAASVAQVHRARLFDGEDVAVKVLRPGVRGKVAADVSVMYFLARRLEATFAEARALNLEAMVREFESAIRRELDLENEARNLRRFREMFAGRSDVHIPAVITDWSSRDVLVMEFVEGDKLTDAAARLDLEQRDELVRTCFDVLYIMVLREGLFHGDLHPGNVKLTPDGAVAIYDLGLVGRLTPLMRDRVVDLLAALSQNDPQLVAESFYEMAVRTQPVDVREFGAAVADLLDSALADRTLGELDLGGVLAKLGELGVRYGMRVPSEYAMMIKAVLTLEGVGKALAPQVDPMEVARPYVAEVLRQRFSPERLLSEGMRALFAVSRLTRELPPTLQEVMHSVEGGRIRFGVDLSPDFSLGAMLRRAIRPLNDGLLGGSLAIAGALALEHGEALILGLPLGSIILFAGAAVFLGRAVLLGRRG